MAGKWVEVQAEEGSPFKRQTEKLQTRKEPVIKSQSCYPTAGDPPPLPRASSMLAPPGSGVISATTPGGQQQITGQQTPLGGINGNIYTFMNFLPAFHLAQI